MYIFIFYYNSPFPAFLGVSKSANSPSILQRHIWRKLFSFLKYLDYKINYATIAFLSFNGVFPLDGVFSFNGIFSFFGVFSFCGVFSLNEVLSLNGVLSFNKVFSFSGLSSFNGVFSLDGVFSLSGVLSFNGVFYCNGVFSFNGVSSFNGVLSFNVVFSNWAFCFNEAWVGAYGFSISIDAFFLCSLIYPISL